MAITGANRHDSMLVEPILDGLSPVKGPGRGRPRRRPGITARIAWIGVDSSERLGRYRWVVERTIAWLLAFRRLAIRYDRSAATVTAVATLAITVICARRLPRKDY